MTDEINWEEQFKKECEDWRYAASVLSDCIIMLDAHEAGECLFDEELYSRAFELAMMFQTKKYEELSNE